MNLQSASPEQEYRLEAIHQQWVSTLDAIRDAIFVADREGGVVRANQSFADLVDMDFAEITQSTIGEILPWLVDGAGGVRTGRVTGPDGLTYKVRSPGSSIAADGRVFILEDVTDNRALEKVEESYRQGTTKALIETIEALSNALEVKDPYTVQHCDAVATLSKSIALKMGFDAFTAQGIYYGAKVHDIGKLSIPSGILSKPGQLAKAEMNLIRMHSESGYAVVKDLAFPWPVHEIVLQHHERIDGSGYPAGLRGEGIHIAARIVAVADVVEAMSAHRPYRAALGIDAAVAEIRSGRGRIYDPDAVDACVAAIAER